MRPTKNIYDRQRIIVLCLTSTTIWSITAYAGPRPEGDVTPQGVERVRLIGVSRIDELPPLPPNAKANTLIQPLGIPVPMFRVLSDEEMARGTVADTGAATAIVYRNSYDTGFAEWGKADAGNFVGNLLHLGNGFPISGGEIKGYDLLVTHSPFDTVATAAARTSLWDGDPLGLIDTRISDPPQEIPGTACTFSGLVRTGTGGNGCVIDSDQDGTTDTCDGGFLDGKSCEDDYDCSYCPALPGDDILECPGLYRLVCNFDPKVTIPSRNVWMIVEWTEGCRMGWRWALYHHPEVAAVGEENFCNDTCPTAPVPCVDLAVEFLDLPDDFDELPHFCCDTGEPCADGDDCSHDSFCGTGIAYELDAWCFGAPINFASFVASIYANTDTKFMLIPTGASGEHTIVDDEIIMPDGGQMINLEVFAAGWDPDGDGTPRVHQWQATIDSSTYTSGFAGELTNSRPPCTVHTDCPDNHTGEFCDLYGSFCAGVWMDCPERSDLCPDLAICDASGPDPRCGGSHESVVSPPALDPGYPLYAMSLRLESSIDAKGTFEVGFRPDPLTWMRDENSQVIPLVAYIPAKITIEIGKCCDRSGGPGNELCLDDLTLGECDALGGLFFPGEVCDPDIDDSIECGPFCGDNEVNQPSEECDGTDDAACAGPCGPYCFCIPICGDDEVNQSLEQCDGTDDAACPGACGPDCLCGPFCGDGVVNHESEECDGPDDNRCPGQCRDDCTCPSGVIPAVSEWGLVALMLLLLSGARIYYGRQRAFV